MTSQLDFFAAPVLLASTKMAKPQAVVARRQGGFGSEDEEIYRWDADPPVKFLTAFDRFRAV